MKKLKIINIVSFILVVLLTISTIVLSIFLAQKKEESHNHSYSERKIMMFETLPKNKLFLLVIP